jgi:GDP-4-dehydro-6-deoxy-D-mannose reductase
MKALVTGATGFVGPYLCDHLRARGDDVVIAGDERAAFDVTDRDSVMQTLLDARPDVVYHLAAQSHVGRSWQEPSATLRVNVEGTQNVLDAARAADVQRVLVVGSAEEYGRVASVPVREDAPLHPLSPYGASKVAAGVLAQQAWLGSGLETIRVRTFNHTGPGQSPMFFVAGFAQRIAAAERDGGDDAAVQIGSLDPVREMNDVRDVVRAYRLLIEHGRPGEVYNVCRGEGFTIGDIALRLLALATRELRLDPDPALMRAADIPELVGDPTKLAATIDWQPEYTLDDTLNDVLAHARQIEPA